VAGLLLKNYKERFAVAPVTATYRYLRQWAAESLPPNPLVSHETSVRHLRDPAFLVRALRWDIPCHDGDAGCTYDTVLVSHVSVLVSHVPC
jgi:hypothetical protein